MWVAMWKNTGVAVDGVHGSSGVHRVDADAPSSSTGYPHHEVPVLLGSRSLPTVSTALTTTMA
jgi:hypothetical protein